MSGFVWKKGDMRGQRLNLLLIFIIIFLFLWTLLVTFISSESHVERYRPPAYKKSEIDVSSDNRGEQKEENQQKTDLNTADLDKDKTDNTAVDASNVEPHGPPAQKESVIKAPPVSSDNKGEKKVENQQKTNLKTADLDKDKTVKKDRTAVGASRVQPKKSPLQKKMPCNDCKVIADEVLQYYSSTWTKQEANYQNFRSELRTKCNAIDLAIMSQANTPLNSKIIYDGDKKTVRLVTQVLFDILVKESPISNKTWDTCAVVGSGGILLNSECGRSIDSAQFVIRCNLPPLGGEFNADVGSKTNIVTANPSILRERYQSLTEYRRPFVEYLRKYGKSMMLLPAFSFSDSASSAMRASFTVEEFGIPIQTTYLNPTYLKKLFDFWVTQGMTLNRLSSGLMMTSVALEICNNVDLYGFWPFSNHPYGSQLLTVHYYDNKPWRKGVHNMPVEFDLLLQMHNQGIIRLHLGRCGKQ